VRRLRGHQEGQRADFAQADRRRLLEHLAEADEVDRLMREPGGLSSVAEPVPLHRRRVEAAPVTALTEPPF
jgi:hypothetical protein